MGHQPITRGATEECLIHVINVGVGACPAVVGRRRGREAALAAERHPTLYYDDGNVVLSGSPKTANANISGPQVRSRSTFPRARRSLCPPPLLSNGSATEIAEMQDSIDDLVSFLTMFYDPLDRIQALQPNTPVLVQGALKLAAKYECEALRHQLIASLEADWPQTLAQWDARRAEAVLLRSEHALQVHGRVAGLYLDDRLPEPASAIRTGRLRFGARTARWRLLDTRDLMRLVRGQKLLAAHTRAIGTDVFGTRCPRGSRGCTKARGDCWRYFQENAPNSLEDPLDILHDCMRLDSLFSELPCASCTREIVVMAEKKRRELWRSLPAVFNLQ
ncbi:uncharacterized protein BXZ73DRAFT_91979 [Epithele typhae]|uniref:uncharacterized protein n=1 Tax=Epithele typhae TaxID=378194 RepID=UPI002007BAB5|nr:uncharacterized protein BXZ73DRAFT_91979 [Epithele typhae]KAH9920252.1 hypothetical protein BXZ73DRAFT_91979 [Epithele typhae]